MSDARDKPRPRGFGKWHVLSIIETGRGSETRVMRRSVTRRGAEGWAKFYQGLLDRVMDQEPRVPIPAGFRHYYEVARFDD